MHRNNKVNSENVARDVAQWCRASLASMRPQVQFLIPKTKIKNSENSKAAFPIWYPTSLGQNGFLLKNFYSWLSHLKRIIYDFLKPNFFLVFSHTVKGRRLRGMSLLETQNAFL